MAGVVWPRRGEIYWVTLDPVVGTEIAKSRPAVIISNNVGNEYSPRVIVAPFTRGGGDRVYPFQVLVQPAESGLELPAKVVLDQIRTVDKARLRQRVGVLAAERMADVDRAIRISLALE